jgi:hypothetical protein
MVFLNDMAMQYAACPLQGSDCSANRLRIFHLCENWDTRRDWQWSRCQRAIGSGIERLADARRPSNPKLRVQHPNHFNVVSSRDFGTAFDGARQTFIEPTSRSAG